MIRVEAVRFLYESFEMRFDLQVDDGEVLAIIGPSGGGKSTLLNLIAGFEQPLSGDITIDGRSMRGVPPAERPVSMVFQDFNTFAHLDVWTNVALGISPSLRLSEQDRAKLDQALARTGLEALGRRKPNEVSGGERQRVAIARALVRDRPILLLDEPFGALGPGLRRQMLDLILALKKERGLTVVFVSHQPEDARYAASHTAFLADGRIVAKRPTAELFADMTIPGLKDYLGDWRSNFPSPLAREG